MTPRVMLFIAATLLALGALAQPATQKSVANGVTVAVTPGAFAADAKTWDFAIALDTHSAELSDDLMSSAVLVDERGAQFKPLAWEGAAPGGHHRAGVLRFMAIVPAPQSITLRLTRPAEGAPRVFRWQVN